MFDRSRLLIVFDQEATAKLLTNYLKSQNIAAELVAGTELYPYQIFILEPQQWDKAVVIKDQFLANPQDERFQVAQNPWETGKVMPGTPIMGNTMFKIIPYLKMYFMTSLFSLLGLLGLVAINAYGDDAFRLLQMQSWSYLFETGEWWRLWTPAFLHFSTPHLVFGIFWLWILGKDIEKHFGHLFLLLLLSIAILVSNYAQFGVAGAGFGGFSGVSYALLGFSWWIGWLRPKWGVRIPKGLVGLLLILLVLDYFGVLGGAMFTLKLVGLVVGCAVALVLSQAGPEDQLDDSGKSG